ncbi:MAG: acyltransferase family protein [Thermoanaerobaculia bacterium]
MTTSRDGAPSLNYIPGFDGLRGIAVVSVMLHHFAVPGFAGGFVGVDVFFLLSGFLITRILQSRFEKERRVPFADFYGRRARRILPAFWTMTAILSLVVLVDPGYVSPDLFFHSAGIALVFLTQWQIIIGDLPGPLIHLWSLGWEENFYLLWPLLFAFAARRAAWRGFRIAVAAAVVAITSMRFGNYWLAMPVPMGLWAFAYFRVDAIILGCALALFTTPSEPSAQRRRGGELFAAVALVVLAAIFTVSNDPFFWAGGFTLVSLCTLTIANHLRRREPSTIASLLELTPLRWTGLISYGLYLWHYPVHWWMQQRGLPKPLTVLLSFVVTYLVAAGSYYTIEAWFRRARPRRVVADPAKDAPAV